MKTNSAYYKKVSQKYFDKLVNAFLKDEITGEQLKKALKEAAEK